MKIERETIKAASCPSLSGKTFQFPIQLSIILLKKKWENQKGPKVDYNIYKVDYNDCWHWRFPSPSSFLLLKYDFTAFESLNKHRKSSKLLIISKGGKRLSLHCAWHRSISIILVCVFLLFLFLFFVYAFKCHDVDNWMPVTDYVDIMFINDKFTLDSINCRPTTNSLHSLSPLH